jgi:uncharacterized protein YoxC
MNYILYIVMAVAALLLVVGLGRALRTYLRL